MWIEKLFDRFKQLKTSAQSPLSDMLNDALSKKGDDDVELKSDPQCLGYFTLVDVHTQKEFMWAHLLNNGENFSVKFFSNKVLPTNIVVDETRARARMAFMENVRPFLMDGIDEKALGNELFKEGVGWVARNADPIFKAALDEAELTVVENPGPRDPTTFAIGYDSRIETFRVFYYPPFLVEGTLNILLSSVADDMGNLIMGKPTLWDNDKKMMSTLAKPLAFVIMHELYHQFYSHQTANKKLGGIGKLVTHQQIQQYGDAFINNHLANRFFDWPAGAEVFGIMKSYPTYEEGRLKMLNNDIKNALFRGDSLFQVTKKGRYHQKAFGTDTAVHLVDSYRVWESMMKLGAENPEETFVQSDWLVFGSLSLDRIFRLMTNAEPGVSSLEFIQTCYYMENIFQTSYKSGDGPQKFVFRKKSEVEEGPDEPPGPEGENPFGDDGPIGTGAKDKGKNTGKNTNKPEQKPGQQFPIGSTVRDKQGNEYIIMDYNEETGEYSVGKPEDGLGQKKLPQ